MEALHGMIQSGVVIDVRDGTHDSPGYVDSGYPLVTSKNLQDGLIDFSKVSFIKKEDYQQINKRSKVEAGDLLFAMIGTIGNPVVVKEEPLFAIKNVALFKGNPKYDMNFLSYYLRSSKIKEKFEREAKGTTQRFLGLGYLRTLEIPNVPIHDQLEIVRELEQFESESKKLELNLKSRLKSLIELNNSILSSFFTSDSDENVVA
jgi:type I restriction enzyme S subunit